MKKLLTTAAALCFSVTMFAQSSTPSTSGSTQTEDTKNTPQASSPSSTSTSSQTGQKSSASASDRSGKDVKLTGCVEERNGQFFLQTGANKEVQLQSSEDLTAHVGHKIRAIGNWSASGSASLRS